MRKALMWSVVVALWLNALNPWIAPTAAHAGDYAVTSALIGIENAIRSIYVPSCSR